MNFTRYLPRPLPAELSDLTELALDMRWSWNHSADVLWEAIDPELWAATNDPWLILESISDSRLEELARDPGFIKELDRHRQARQEYLRQPTWFSQAHRKEELGSVAYLSMEFGLSEALPIYSGGLGILAGDYMKTASDLGIPVVGVGLLYQQGYFRQALDTNGEQLAFYPYNAPTMLPVMPLSPDGGWLRIKIQLPGRTLHLRAWQVRVGRVTLYLLDSNDPLNAPGDRSITAELYGGGHEMRLQQEIVLGIGGWRLMEKLHPECRVCHLNEGHAALAVLERARSFAERTGQPFFVALRCTRAGNIFTTHTPVAAGFDTFSPDLFSEYAKAYAARLGIGVDQLLGLGRANPEDHGEPFNMAYLAVRGCGIVNGVSRLHGQVSRRIFQPLFPRWPQAEVPIGHVTNGVHVPSWDSAEADTLWTESCGKGRWLGDLEKLKEGLECLTEEALWTFRTRCRSALVERVRERIARQRAAHGADQETIYKCAHLFDVNALTIGLARRFTGYKRPNLLLSDPERMARILTDSTRPVQLIVAGKAHPRDEEGRRMVREWAEFMRREGVCKRAVFLEDYDMALASELVQGVDLWINTPRRPWEACGTSGMKILVNGGLNLSELDGWWAEAYSPEVGWPLGDGKEHDTDPAWDRREAEELYTLLEQQVIPAFYNRNGQGIPAEWVARMRASMTELTARFSSNRMVREYTEHYYIPSDAAFRERAASKGQLGTELEKWYTSLTAHWAKLRFGKFDIERSGDEYVAQVQVYLGETDPDAVRVELYADAPGDGAPAAFAMERGSKLAGAVNGYLYTAQVPNTRPATDYTPRIVPSHAASRVPLEAEYILWLR
jgi:glycogen phosphorylase